MGTPTHVLWRWLSCSLLHTMLCTLRDASGRTLLRMRRRPPLRILSRTQPRIRRTVQRITHLAVPCVVHAAEHAKPHVAVN
eukprot:4590920-Pleurochrysis_carterae.AAC.2